MFRNLFHGPILETLLMTDFPNPAEAAEADLVVKLIRFKLVFLLNKQLAISQAELDWTAIFGDQDGVIHGHGRCHFGLLEGRPLDLRVLVMVVAISLFYVGGDFGGE